MQREFNIGSNWLYYKIYCGVKTSDIILLDHLMGKISDLKANNLIEKWFFIRYIDPEPHIRLRFLLSEKSNLTQVIQTFESTFNALQSQNIIWKIQVETYVRELERYSSTTYELTETIFDIDSDLVLKYLTLKNLFQNENISLLFSFKVIDSLLNSFNFSIKEKLTLLYSMQESFKKEFDTNKVLKKELDKNYRVLFQEITSVLVGANIDIKPLLKLIEAKEAMIKEIVSVIKINLEVPDSSYLSSLIHMFINRQYTSRQREYELIIYDHLHRFYKTQYFKNQC